MRQLLLAILLQAFLPQAQALSWQDLWVTKNHQAQTMMDTGQYDKAQETFDDPAWQATAAYRAGHYKDAAMRYQSLKNNPDASYNQGNALAQGGQLEPAIKAYDNALTIDPTNQDALHNRKIVAELLKKEKEKQNKQEQNKQEQNKQEQNNQDQNKQDQNKQDQNKQDQNKQDQNKQDQNKQDQNKQDQNKQDQNKQDKIPESHSQSQSQTEREQQHAKEQWLRLIPDDPGGLMREKFLRDYLSRRRAH